MNSGRVGWSNPSTFVRFYLKVLPYFQARFPKPRPSNHATTKPSDHRKATSAKSGKLVRSLLKEGGDNLRLTSDFQKIWTDNPVSRKTNAYTRHKTVSVMSSAQSKASTVFQDHRAATAGCYPEFCNVDESSIAQCSVVHGKPDTNPSIKAINTQIPPNFGGGCDVEYRLEPPPKVPFATGSPNLGNDGHFIPSDSPSQPEKSTCTTDWVHVCSVQDVSGSSSTCTTMQPRERQQTDHLHEVNTVLSTSSLPLGSIPFLTHSPTDRLCTGVPTGLAPPAGTDEGPLALPDPLPDLHLDQDGTLSLILAPPEQFSDNVHCSVQGESPADCMQVDGQDDRPGSQQSPPILHQDILHTSLLSPVKQDLQLELNTVNLSELRSLGIDFDSDMSTEFQLTAAHSAVQFNHQLSSPTKPPQIGGQVPPTILPRDAVVIYENQSDIVREISADAPVNEQPITSDTISDWSTAQTSHDSGTANPDRREISDRAALDSPPPKASSFAELISVLNAPTLTPILSGPGVDEIEDWVSDDSPPSSPKRRKNKKRRVDDPTFSKTIPWPPRLWSFNRLKRQARRLAARPNFYSDCGGSTPNKQGKTWGSGPKNRQRKRIVTVADLLWKKRSLQ